MLYLYNELSLFVANETITAIQSGDFYLSSTWNNTIMPRNGSTVIIPCNVTVYIGNQSSLTINIQSIRVFGILQIGSPTNSSLTTFTFQYPTNIMIFKGGILQDLTTTHVWTVTTNTIITIYNGSSFNSLQNLKLNSNFNNSTETFNSSINGPYTITIDLQGKIQNYSCKKKREKKKKSYFYLCLAITFAPCVSGDFGLNSTWLGGLAPTIDRCSPNDGGCNMIIPQNFNITRTNNQSTINGVNIYVYGLFEISSWATYSFLYPIHFFIYNGGIFKDSTVNGFFLNINTSFDIDNGGLFITKNPTYINSYFQNVAISQIALNNSRINGPYSIVIYSNGTINNNGKNKEKTIDTKHILILF